MHPHLDPPKVAFDRTSAKGYERFVDSGVSAWFGSDLVPGIAGFDGRWRRGGEVEDSAGTSELLPLGDDSYSVERDLS